MIVFFMTKKLIIWLIIILCIVIFVNKLAILLWELFYQLDRKKLIIILNRGKGIEFKVKINFLEEINLENFIEMKQTGCNYKLIGVITHLGESGMGGHFIAYFKNPISNEWNKYNDSIVSPVQNFKTEVIDYAMPYLLFYQKIN